MARRRPVRKPPHPLSVRNHSDLLRLTIEEQLARATIATPGGPFEMFMVWRAAMAQRTADADFLVVALSRLLRLARWTLEADFATPELSAAVAQFEAAVPNLFDFRDTQEHFDDYGGGVGDRQLRGEQPSGWGYGLGPFGPVLTYASFMVNMAEAVAAARNLHKAIRQCVDARAATDVHGGPETVIISDP